MDKNHFSMKEITLYSLFMLLLFGAEAKDQNVLMTEVFAIVVDPPMFNWTYEGVRDQFTYEASLSDSPDLPSWIHYVFSEKHHSGFLYGVPPSQSKAVTSLDIVALNKKSYETRVENVNIIIQEKLNSARYEVHMKINNLNVADMFDVERMDALKDIFTRHLWKDSEDDLYVTFLESAVEMGARKPLNPNEGEGVVVRLGSEVMFSSELLELQDQVRPLYMIQSIQSCPREFIRTSVERFFRDARFALDWCSFRLIQKDVNNSAMHKSDGDKLNAESEELVNKWQPSFRRADVPVRSYKRELVMAIALPMVIMTILVFALTFILCFEHDDFVEHPATQSNENADGKNSVDGASQSSDDELLPVNPEAGKTPPVAPKGKTDQESANAVLPMSPLRTHEQRHEDPNLEPSGPANNSPRTQATVKRTAPQPPANEDRFAPATPYVQWERLQRAYCDVNRPFRPMTASQPPKKRTAVRSLDNRVCPLIIGLSDEAVVSTQEQCSPQRFLDPKNHIDTLGNCSSDRDHNSMSPDVMLLSGSPNSTMTRGMHCRPSPPPYVRPKYKPEI